MKTNLNLIRTSELSESLGVSRSTLWRWRRDGVIPEPLCLGPRIIAWKRDEVYDALNIKQ